MILLDTQAWLRLAAEPERLSRAAAAAIRRNRRAEGLGISVYSIWEACWLHRQARVRTPRPLREWLSRILESTTVAVQPLTPEVCLVATELPADVSRDPGDRLIAATALVLGCPLVTADERLRASRSFETIW